MNDEILNNISELLIPLDMSTELNILVVSKLDTEPITLSRIVLCFSKINVALNHSLITQVFRPDAAQT